MKRPRTLLKLGLLILAGAIVNVAVAWGCAAFMNVFDGDWRNAADPNWSVIVREAFGATRAVSRRSRSIDRTPDMSASTLVASWLPVSHPMPEYRSGVYKIEERTIDCRGWPMRSLYCELSLRMYSISAGEYVKGRSGAFRVFAAPFNETLGDRARYLNASPMTVVASHDRLLPYFPLWPGFAINTIFYAGILWVVFFAPGRLRRTLRRRRGLCPACAYPVGASPVCTECGNLLDQVRLNSRTGMGLPPPATPAQDS